MFVLPSFWSNTSTELVGVGVEALGGEGGCNTGRDGVVGLHPTKLLSMAAIAVKLAVFMFSFIARSYDMYFPNSHFPLLNDFNFSCQSHMQTMSMDYTSCREKL